MLSVVVPLPLALLHHPPSALQPMLSRPRQQLLRYGHSAALLRARHTLASLVSSGQQPPRPLSTAATGARLINLYALSDEELANLLSEWNEKPYRVKQIRKWLYERGAHSFDSMSDLPKKLRDRLEAIASFGALEVEHEQISKDGTQKRLWRLEDGQLIESVLMPYNTNRRTACISSQVGCAMGCTFCATGQMGFKRSLSSAEIFEQAARFSSELRAREERLSNVVFMGMGEPFRNFDAVMGAVRLIQKELGIGARHITISTVGIAPVIRQFADVCAEESLELKLAISLHQADDAARSLTMPVNRKYPIAELIDACHYYVERVGRRVTFEWALIAGENDDMATAQRLAKLLKGLKAHVNLIPLNPTRGFGGRPSALPSANRFVDELNRCGIPATVRVRRGIDIDAGCGQLADAVSKEKAAERLGSKSRSQRGGVGEEEDCAEEE